MRSANYALALVFALSCTKTDTAYISGSNRPICFDCSFLLEQYQDTAEHPTILGQVLENPYLLPNMTRAYQNVYGKHADLRITHHYIIFSPASFDELARLENEDIDLVDYPLDRELVSEGNYYEQPGKTPEDIPDYYAVVQAGYVPPAGIESRILASMYIPDNDPALENEALRLSNTLLDQGPLGPKSEPNRTAEALLSREDCSHTPSGSILVEEILSDVRTKDPVPGVRIVIRRHFKSEQLYTDEHGVFRSRKYFRNKYTIVAKFKNAKGHITRSRPSRIHEQFFAIRINLGKWDNLDCMHAFIIPHVNRTGTIATSHWCAATTHHALWNYHKLCRKFGIGTPPEELRILLNHKMGAGNGNTYMLRSIMQDGPAAMVAGGGMVNNMLRASGPIGAAASFSLARYIRVKPADIHYGYGKNPAFLTTDRYTELVMHELAHASHFKKVGTLWWANFGMAEFSNEGEGDYGGCCNRKASMIALGEGWAFLIGHLFADLEYGLRSTAFPEQGFIAQNRDVIQFGNQGTISSHIYFLESFNPNRRLDPSFWVPKGLLYDMMDEKMELFPASGIRDQVSGFNCSQIFGLMGPDLTSMEAFKTALIRRYGANQKQPILDLFAQYGY